MSYIKLVINNYSQVDYYLSQCGTKTDLSVMQPTIIKNTTATYMCKNEKFRDLNVQMRFWCARDLYSSSWSGKAFCVFINNSDAHRLLVHTCAKDDSLDYVLSGTKGKQIIDLTKNTTYGYFYDSYIYASVATDGYKGVEVCLQIGGNPRI
ncbi:hypothetical protein C1645_779950 [Glomus cerebriforme]|uniref:Uncharacterized protein n=1 Tax=Glomus cerebriforme TaxID=658196 RepID=A0A397SN14_9GLOM|nr:hypothetical protein C1645_779950 [Glomus cerebriforme]